VLRLYLDTGDLVRIADGRTDPSELLRVMHETDTSLVISREHVQDATWKCDDATRDRFIAAVERFGVILMVQEGPFTIEPAGGSDIVVVPCTNFGEVVRSPAAKPWMDTANAIADASFAASVDVQGHVAQAPAPLRRKASFELLGQSVVTLIRRGESLETSDVLAAWEAEGLGAGAGPERAAVEARATAFKALVDRLKPLAASGGMDGDDILRGYIDVMSKPEQFPGLHLQLIVGAAEMADFGHERQRSTSVDLEHVAHFPYVDVATVDRQTRHFLVEVAKAKPEEIAPRAPTVLLSGDLDKVARALRDRYQRTPSTDARSGDG